MGHARAGHPLGATVAEVAEAELAAARVLQRPPQRHVVVKHLHEPRRPHLLGLDVEEPPGANRPGGLGLGQGDEAAVVAAEAQKGLGGGVGHPQGDVDVVVVKDVPEAGELLERGDLQHGRAQVLEDGAEVEVDALVDGGADGAVAGLVLVVDADVVAGLRDGRAVEDGDVERGARQEGRGLGEGGPHAGRGALEGAVRAGGVRVAGELHWRQSAAHDACLVGEDAEVAHGLAGALRAVRALLHGGELAVAQRHHLPQGPGLVEHRQHRDSHVREDHVDGVVVDGDVEQPLLAFDELEAGGLEGYEVLGLLARQAADGAHVAGAELDLLRHGGVVGGLSADAEPRGVGVGGGLTGAVRHDGGDAGVGASHAAVFLRAAAKPVALRARDVVSGAVVTDCRAVDSVADAEGEGSAIPYKLRDAGSEGPGVGCDGGYGFGDNFHGYTQEELAAANGAEQAECDSHDFQAADSSWHEMKPDALIFTKWPQ
ncbi:uncharacterized protein BcabD6B2_57070 [Babesia caballi]|uniref:Uncharacterized protein n=1 Tax=Babesia caballi TaxID=5871 RepID=A0AAV4M1C8_BABCB|nr:hypothetical protein BcabD6B2_57070 [Babesia caballi]